MILWEKSDCSPDWTELLSILADLAKLTEKCSKTVDCYLKAITDFFDFHFKVSVFFDQVAQYMDITVS